MGSVLPAGEGRYYMSPHLEILLLSQLLESVTVSFLCSTAPQILFLSETSVTRRRWKGIPNQQQQRCQCAALHVYALCACVDIGSRAQKQKSHVWTEDLTIFQCRCKSKGGSVLLLLSAVSRHSLFCSRECCNCWEKVSDTANRVLKF